MSEKTDFKAFEEGGADQLLREALAGHRVAPKPALWKGISRKLLWSELVRFNFTNLSPKYWAAGAIGILMIASGIYLGSRVMATDDPIADAADDMITSDASRNDPGVLSSAGHLTGSVTKSVETDKISRPDLPREAKVSGSDPAVAHVPEPVSRRSVAVGAQHSAEPLIAASTAPVTGNQANNVAADRQFSASTAISRMLPCEAFLPGLAGIEDTIITITNAGGVYNVLKTSSGSAPFFSAGVGLSPEISFYSAPEAYSKANFWLNSTVAYTFSRFSLVSGLGLGYVYDEGKYKVEYKSLDSVGYYTGVASYTVGVNNEIIYNTKTISVYDSLYHLGDFRTKNRYTYIQIPLLVGYRLFESGRTSLTFRAGPAVSILVATRKSDPVIEYENARIIRTDDETPTRVSTNWQIWASIYFEMRMNKQVSIYLEPSFKYYMKPMVEQENVSFKAPMTIGLGVGLQFNFGKKPVKL